MSGQWGKAGVRLTPEEKHRRGIQAAALRQKRAENLDKAYTLWRAGEFRPHVATTFLDIKGLWGPEVDEACGVEEPAVDLWEAGKLYPSWSQMVALADLCGTTPYALVHALEPIPWRETSMRFHFPTDEPDDPPVRRCEPDAIAAVVRAAPERRPR